MTSSMFLYCLAFIVLLLMELNSHVTNESYSSHDKDLLSRNTALFCIVLKFEFPSRCGKLRNYLFIAGYHEGFIHMLIVEWVVLDY